MTLGGRNLAAAIANLHQAMKGSRRAEAWDVEAEGVVRMRTGLE